MKVMLILAEQKRAMMRVVVASGHGQYEFASSAKLNDSRDGKKSKQFLGL